MRSNFVDTMEYIKDLKQKINEEEININDRMV